MVKLKVKVEVEVEKSSCKNKALASFDGFNNSGNGALTQTTATLTPTVLRNIEQTFLDYADDTTNSLPFQAGFVPPIAPAYQTSSSIINGTNNNSSTILTDHEYSMDSSSMSSSSWHTTPPPQDIVIESAKHNKGVANNNNNNSVNNKNTVGKAPRRNVGGRRPNRPSNLTPEEEQKRAVRRERNKMAAARCRRRREDHTNELMQEVEGLENVKKGLQMDMQKLQREKEELEFLLQNHRTTCKRQVREIPMTQFILPTVDRIKSEPVEESFDNDCRPPSPKRALLSSVVFNSNPSQQTQQTQALPQIQTVVQQRPNRPNTLNVPMTMHPSSQALNNVQIETPSNGTVNFNFDSLMEGGTGLTPINHPLKVITDPRHGLDLITPTSDASRLCSL
ncbi:transcription factor kayak isoform X2 [Culicoides brevitarsis]|uniref:transcription factor kayak isoform X2 n=1 Tax=Culicoides brevitarsis TaxID=469753 RepID=UPI00307B8DC6